jgi:deoxyhypusine synthase
MADHVESRTAAPSKATNAVLLHSDPVPEGVQKVQGIDFNKHHAADITAAQLVDGMSNMGFQASALADAVQIINQMVRQSWIPASLLLSTHVQL